MFVSISLWKDANTAALTLIFSNKQNNTMISCSVHVCKKAFFLVSVINTNPVTCLLEQSKTGCKQDAAVVHATNVMHSQD